MLNKMKLFGKMKILEKVENENLVCFRKTGQPLEKATFHPVCGFKTNLSPIPL